MKSVYIYVDVEGGFAANTISYRQSQLKQIAQLTNYRELVEMKEKPIYHSVYSY